jgi:hypothetical protein
MAKFQKVVFWIPRAMGSILVLIVIYEIVNIPINRPGIQNTTARFILDLIPIFIVFAIGWRRQWIGAILYLISGLYYLYKVLDHGKYWTDYLLLSGSTLILGILLLLVWTMQIAVSKMSQKKGK